MEYLLRVSLSKVDSQHFWDLMDCLPEDAIEKVELDILGNVQQHYGLGGDTLFFDTTNFYTFVDSTNAQCDIAQRGKNKQKRNDLRQVGLALVVTRQDFIPLFHHTYQGNMNDAKVFRQVLGRIKRRMKDLNMDFQKHTLVFDRGCNSKKNLALVARMKFHYVGALTPSQHLRLIQDAEENFSPTDIGDKTLSLYRDKRTIWGEERTVVVFISEKLKAGQLGGIYQALKKRKGMSHRPLKVDGGRRVILRDIRGQVYGLRSCLSGMNSSNQQGHRSESLDPAKVLFGLDQAGGTPAKCHRSTPPPFDVPGDALHGTLDILDEIG